MTSYNDNNSSTVIAPRRLTLAVLAAQTRPEGQERGTSLGRDIMMMMMVVAAAAATVKLA